MGSVFDEPEELVGGEFVGVGGGEDVLGEEVALEVAEALAAKEAEVDFLGGFGEVGDDDEVVGIVPAAVEEDMGVVAGEEFHVVAAEGFGLLAAADDFLQVEINAAVGGVLFLSSRGRSQFMRGR